MKILLKDLLDLLITTLYKSGEDDIFTFSAAIAFYTIFSIAPLLILILSFGGFFLDEQMILAQIKQVGGEFLDEDTLITINEFISERINFSGGVVTSMVAIGMVIFGATTVISQLKVALNKIWNIEEVSINSVWNFAFNRALSFLMILIFSALFILSLIAESMLGLVESMVAGLFPELILDPYLLMSQIGTIGFAVLSFTLIFKILPDVHASWKDVIVGAVVTTLLFLLGKYLIGVYFSAAGIDATFRAAGSLIVFVIWVYYNILIILLGAVFTQVYTAKYGSKILPYKFVTLKGVPKLKRKEE
ncbi:MAG: YihY/virulence factor BrkB family protein [Balneolaceae bacterium]|nr:MAG: YihY/virulence factor BrkB family protein [Balneolaceae bacterium]